MSIMFMFSASALLSLSFSLISYINCSVTNPKFGSLDMLLAIIEIYLILEC
jgi:hypothetical protein